MARAKTDRWWGLYMAIVGGAASKDDVGFGHVNLKDCLALADQALEAAEEAAEEGEDYPGCRHTRTVDACGVRACPNNPRRELP